MFDVNCPYCHYAQHIPRIDELANLKENEFYTRACIKCKKIFSFRTQIFFRFNARKADCKNGGDHEWHDVANHKGEYYLWCPGCNETKQKEKKRKLKFTTGGKK